MRLTEITDGKNRVIIKKYCNKHYMTMVNVYFQIFCLLILDCS